MEIIVFPVYSDNLLARAVLLVFYQAYRYNRVSLELNESLLTWWQENSVISQKSWEFRHLIKIKSKIFFKSFVARIIQSEFNPNVFFSGANVTITCLISLCKWNIMVWILLQPQTNTNLSTKRKSEEQRTDLCLDCINKTGCFNLLNNNVWLILYWRFCEHKAYSTVFYKHVTLISRPIIFLSATHLSYTRVKEALEESFKGEISLLNVQNTLFKKKLEWRCRLIR